MVYLYIRIENIEQGKRNGEIPIVIPEERGIEYFNYLQNYDTNGLTNMIKELQEVEISKLKEYGINI